MLKILNPKDFEPFYQILQESFPPDELRSRQEHYHLFSCPVYKVYARYEKGQLLGFLTVWDLEQVAFIEHFAVAAPYRNRGLGAQLLEALGAVLGKPLCLEAELPETEIASRRLGFYQRNGFTVNPQPYMQPALEPGKNPVPLHLLTTGGLAPDFEKLKTQIYSIVYNGKV